MNNTIKGGIYMKIVVDSLPEHPKYCLFSKINDPECALSQYKCTLSNSTCVYYHAGWEKTCPYLIENGKI